MGRGRPKRIRACRSSTTCSSSSGSTPGWDLSVTCKGDLDVDGHHTVEDVGLAIGQALAEALGDKAGIRRFASITVPLDEAAVEVALDLSGRNFVAPRGRRAGRDDRHVRHGARRGLRARVRAGGRPHGARAASIRDGPRTMSSRRSSRRSRRPSATRARRPAATASRARRERCRNRGRDRRARLRQREPPLGVPRARARRRRADRDGRLPSGSRRRMRS